MYHKNLAKGRWSELSVIEQFANIGSEVERAISWKTKGKKEMSDEAVKRGLELIELTRNGVERDGLMREISRVREVLVDYFWGENEYRSSGEGLRRYFMQYGVVARRGR